MDMSERWSENRRRGMLAAMRQRREREASPTPVPERITTALDIQGLFGPEVDRACGVEEPAVDLWESGELVPTAEQVEALAALTGFPVTFFYIRPTAGITLAWMCGDDGCHVIDNRPDAAVIALPVRPL